MRRRLAGLVAIVGLTALAGCGYTTHSLISEQNKTIYVEPLKNNINITSESDANRKYRLNYPQIETDITRYISDKFFTDGTFKPVQEKDADLVLRGSVQEFRKDPLRYDDNDNVTEYRINLIVNISLWDNKANKLMWTEGNFTGDYTYFVTGSQAISEETALTNALDDLARRVVERTTEDW